ncbi:ATP-dependent DNA ligase Cdc17 [Dispira parvispora]|uniref:DNA ligase n=1 Tax=Dispira parvispora TaxID=1520584 RepID=A0A9W8AWG3_9FUNG|nr:ATP-dependent DNA ligase Cdc17 [Dispira parvispora]
MATQKSLMGFFGAAGSAAKSKPKRSPKPPTLDDQPKKSEEVPVPTVEDKPMECDPSTTANGSENTESLSEPVSDRSSPVKKKRRLRRRRKAISTSDEETEVAIGPTSPKDAAVQEPATNLAAPDSKQDSAVGSDASLPIQDSLENTLPAKDPLSVAVAEKQAKAAKPSTGKTIKPRNKAQSTGSGKKPTNANLLAPPEVVERFAEMIQTDVSYAALCYMFEQVEATTKRLLIADILTHFFRRVIAKAPQELLPLVYLCINRLSPQYEGIELGVGESLLIKAVAEATGRGAAKVKADVVALGDIGLVAKESRSTQRTMTMFKTRQLKVAQVFQTLKQIATTSGHASMSHKVGKIKGMLATCQGNEAKYLMRSLEGKLRIGLAEQTVLVALAHAFVLHHQTEKLDVETLAETLQEAAATVKSVYNELPSYDVMIPALLEHGVDKLSEFCKLTPGIPVKPMLAHPTKSISEVLDRFENHTFTCEYKYDGERAQIHRLEDGRTLIFSRNSENMTAKYPDVMDKMNRALVAGTGSFILDCEAVAWDRAQRKILPFQILSTRKRKDVKESEITVQVCVFAFDLLYLNGRSLLRVPLAERRKLLAESFRCVDGDFQFAKSQVITDVEEIQTFLDESVEDNCEGLMVKTLDGDEASYEPSRRSRNWLKVKKDYISGIGDTLDLMVMGAYAGRGKRTGVYGGFLLSCYNPDNEHYEAICKIGTGFTEADLESHRDILRESIISQPRSYYNFGDSVKPDVWFEPRMVWEIRAADLSISPVYQAAVGKVDSYKGISLRFPRFVRIRDDKGPEDATTSDQIADMYQSQKINSVDHPQSDDN